MPAEGLAAVVNQSGRIRRLRSTSFDPSGLDTDSDLKALSFATATRAQPHIKDFIQMPGEQQTTVRLSVVNNSPHESPDGGMTLSFPDLVSPGDRERILDVVVPEGMSLHVIPAGGQLFGRTGRLQLASYLMVEVHGPWHSGQRRTMEVVIEHDDSTLPIQYRSALSDATGDYWNTPTSASTTDQQGWPVESCLLGSGLARRTFEEDPASDSQSGH
jgi:hypothetical protein